MFANAPAAALPTIVLPDFARSLSADIKEKHILLNNNSFY